MAKRNIKVVGYRVITNRIPIQLDKQINTALANGWQLYGELKLAVVGESGKEEIVYIQTIVLKQSEEGIIRD